MILRICVISILLAVTGFGQISFANVFRESDDEQFEYRLLATNRTSTMEKEMNQAAEEGFRFEGVMGGETSFGGDEAVVIMAKMEAESKSLFQYKLLATNRTSTMQKEMKEAADEGFYYKGQSVFRTTFGGNEVVIIMERDRNSKPVHHEYKLLATKRTSTMQKEINEAGRTGFAFLGITVSKTAFGGSEVVIITGKKRID